MIVGRFYDRYGWYQPRFILALAFNLCRGSRAQLAVAALPGRIIEPSRKSGPSNPNDDGQLAFSRKRRIATGVTDSPCWLPFRPSALVS